MSSDHLIVDLGDHPIVVGDEIDFGVGYGALVRAMTSPFVTKIEHLGGSSRAVDRVDAGIRLS
jgi:predicted amino acid racemase